MAGGLYSMSAKDFDQTLDLTKVKPYGDTMNDGKVQVSFTLPVPQGAEAEEAAKLLMKKMGFENPLVAFSHFPPPLKNTCQSGLPDSQAFLALYARNGLIIAL